MKATATHAVEYGLFAFSPTSHQDVVIPHKSQGTPQAQIFVESNNTWIPVLTEMEESVT